MQTNLNSDLITYQLEESEALNGAHLNSLQKAVIQNERVAIIKQLAFLSPSSMNEEGKETYWQQEAYLRGQLDILSNLLDKSRAVEASLDPTNPSPL